MAASFISSHPFLLPPSSTLPLPPPPPLHIHPLFRLSQIDQIFALLGPRPVYFLECVFSSGLACAVVQQCRLRRPTVWLNGCGTEAGTGCGGLSVPAKLAALPSQGKLGLRVSHTAAIHSPSTHRIEYGLFGVQWQCQECWAPVPLWEKMVFGSLSLFPSQPLKGCSSLMRGITRCISQPVSSFLQIPAGPVGEGLPARGILRRDTAFHIGISWPSPPSPAAHSRKKKQKDILGCTSIFNSGLVINIHLEVKTIGCKNAHVLIGLFPWFLFLIRF